MTINIKYIFSLFILLLVGCNSTVEEKQQKQKEKPEVKEKSTDEGKLYIRSFGDSTKPSIIFLHGGPGYNCAGFEVTTAEELANEGFFVIVYDRRGEGRSLDSKAEYTFEQTFDDLNGIYAQFHLDSASLMGHSYGGVVATLYAEKYPEKVSRIFLVGAPISLQETFKTIITSCKKIYQKKKDTENLKYIGMLETMDTTTLEYSSYCFGHAMQNGFYSTQKPNEEAVKIYTLFSTDEILKEHAMKMTQEAPKGFFENENYTSINLTENIRQLMIKNIPIYGYYGQEDGLYSPEQIHQLEKLIGKQNVEYYEQCSHNVYIDQQKAFIESIKATFH